MKREVPSENVAWKVSLKQYLSSSKWNHGINKKGLKWFSIWRPTTFPTLSQIKIFEH